MEQTKKHFRKRDAILACLQESKSHPSAEVIYSRLKPVIPDLSMGTVYRNLNLFKEQGLIISLGTVKGVERFDGDTSSHVHFICTDCGCVQDIPGMPQLPSLRASAEQDLGGQVEGCHITLTGTCRDCIQSNKEEQL